MLDVLSLELYQQDRIQQDYLIFLPIRNLIFNVRKNLLDHVVCSGWKEMKITTVLSHIKYQANNSNVVTSLPSKNLKTISKGN